MIEGVCSSPYSVVMWESHFDGLCVGYDRVLFQDRYATVADVINKGILYCDTLCRPVGHILLPLLWLRVFMLFAREQQVIADTNSERDGCHVVTSVIYASFSYLAR